MTQLTQPTRVRTDVLALGIAGAIGIITLIAALAAETVASLSQAPSLELAQSSAVATGGAEAWLPFAVTAGIFLLAGAIIVLGRRRLSK